MNLADRIRSFAFLGELLIQYPGNLEDARVAPISLAVQRSCRDNGWFTPEHVTIALHGIGQMLQQDMLETWLFPYAENIENQTRQKTVGVVMAGNIPLVGFHDFLCVLISGNKINCRLSSDDAHLLPVMAEILMFADARWHDEIIFSRGRLENFDAVIATGNNTSARHFDYYFRKYPHLIRHNRNSVAIIDGRETNEVLEKMAGDIMLHYGLGCRSVSKIFVPEKYDFKPFIQALEKYASFINHHKYCNNYDFNRTMFLLNQTPVIDPGFILIVEDPRLSSRIAVLHYAYYKNIQDVIFEINVNSQDIQCVVGNQIYGINTVLPGQAQFPVLTDYPDNIDTLKFLIDE